MYFIGRKKKECIFTKLKYSLSQGCGSRIVHLHCFNLKPVLEAPFSISFELPEVAVGTRGFWSFFGYQSFTISFSKTEKKGLGFFDNERIGLSKRTFLLAYAGDPFITTSLSLSLSPFKDSGFRKKFYSMIYHKYYNTSSRL